MIGVPVADSAAETNELHAGLVEEAAGDVAQALIDDLARAAGGGDRAAHESLIASLYPAVLRYCRSRLGRTDSVIGSANDVAQEVCLAVMAAVRTYVMSGRSFRSFVYGSPLTRSTTTSAPMRRNRTEAMADVPDSPVLDDGPDQRLLGEELAERLAGLLQRLAPRQRTVLDLRIAVGLSAEETAEAVGSTGAVRITQHRALNRIRDLVSAPNRRGTLRTRHHLCERSALRTYSKPGRWRSAAPSPRISPNRRGLTRDGG